MRPKRSRNSSKRLAQLSRSSNQAGEKMPDTFFRLPELSRCCDDGNSSGAFSLTAVGDVSHPRQSVCVRLAH